MKKYLTIIILILVSLMVSCQVESTFRSKDINSFLKDFKSKYNQVEKTKVKKYQGGINIYVYFTSTKDTSIDEDTIYEGFKTFFGNKEIAERVSEKFGKSPTIYPNYPIITVYFVDSQEIESHEITTMGNNNNYDEWTEPYYYNKGFYVTAEKASESVQEERREKYSDILSTIMSNHHTYVSVIYNYASLKDEHVVLRVSFNTEDQFYQATESVWINEYDQIFNLVVNKIDWQHIMEYQNVKYIEKYSTEKKFVFASESESEGTISSHYFILDKAKCENTIELKDNEEYRLLFTIEEPNEIVSYIIEED